tara:strand:+ start:2995 stop:3204 length:210 start_codon:yes stop_codon:yes gene_type:complete
VPQLCSLPLHTPAIHSAHIRRTAMAAMRNAAPSSSELVAGRWLRSAVMRMARPASGNMSMKSASGKYGI